MANTSDNQATAKIGNPPGYETTFITRADLSDEGLKALQDRLVGLLPNYQGELVLTEDWGKRKLAYPITKETRGHYTYIVYTGRGEVVHELERNLRLHDHVLRFLTVNLETEFEPETFRGQRAAVHAAAKRREEEREARREERHAERRHYEHDSHDHSDYRKDSDEGHSRGGRDEE
jgi:small subunit ribosomal protein S6